MQIIYLALHTHNRNPIFVFHLSYASKAVCYRTGHTASQSKPLFATALKTSHQTPPWNICLHVWSWFRMSLRAMENPLRGWDPAWHLSWELWPWPEVTVPFLIPFRVLPGLSQSGERHSSCSTAKSCSTTLSSDTFSQPPVQNQ